MSVSSGFVPVAPLSNGGDSAFRDIYQQLPAEWIAERALWAKIAGRVGFGEHNLAAGRDATAQMLAAGFLERRVEGTRIEYRPAAKSPLPSEPLTALQAQRREDERKAGIQRDVEDREAAQRERVREELARPIIEARDREFLETAERLLDIAGLKSEVTALRAEVA